MNGFFFLDTVRFPSLIIQHPGYEAMNQTKSQRTKN